MTVTGTAVRARGLRKVYRPARYREVVALNGLDLDIGAGEIVALLGPNGPAVEAGAAGYLLKDTPRDTLVGAIFAAARGETVLAPRWPAA